MTNRREVPMFLRPLLLCLILPGAAFAADHPMDPLDEAEMTRAVRVLQDANRVQRGAWLPYMRLMEPPKAEVRAWKPGEKLPTRAAEVFVFQQEKIFRAEIDLDASRERSWREVPGAKPPFIPDEFSPIDRLVRSNRQWQEAIAKRGINNPNQVMNMSFTVGNFGNASDNAGRIFAIASFLGAPPVDYWGRHIGGLVTWVDMRSQRVIRVIDTGPVPIPVTPASFDGAINRRRPGLNEIEYAQSRPSFELDGHQVEWQNWSFHWRVDPQVGLILSNIRFANREVLYQAHLSEMFVPYMDPGPEFHFRTFIDAGEYGMGRMLSPLRAGIDCPRDATLIDTAVANAVGRPQPLPNAIGIFERYSGNPLWRHDDQVVKVFNGTRAQELVVRTIATVGNYDYILDWNFRLDGTLDIGVGSTGQPGAKSVAPLNLEAPGGTAAESTGRFVGDHTVAVHHSHFISFRLDFDVDGTENYFIQDRMNRTNYSGSPRRSGWTAETVVADRENNAKMIVNLQNPSQWRIASSERKNAWGRPSSYRIMPGMTGVSLLDPNDWPQRRAAFSEYNLWVTPYNANERYAAGAFPNQSDGSDGLHRWTQQNRPIRDTDLVAWYTMGFHHIVRAEDWPVMPTMWTHLTLTPHDFFDRNPMIR